MPNVYLVSKISSGIMENISTSSIMHFEKSYSFRRNEMGEDETNLANSIDQTTKIILFVLDRDKMEYHL